MAKKESTESFFKTLFQKQIVPNLLTNLKSFVDSTIKNTQRSIHNTIQFAIKKVYSSFLILLGIIFLFVGIGILIENSLTLPKGSGFIILGAVIALIGFIFNLFIKKE